MNKAAVAGKVSQGLRSIFTYGFVAVVALALAPAMVANAATIQVTNSNDSGAGSLRQAIGDAGIGEEITFADNVTGTITLTSGELVIDKNLSITGPGADMLTISGNNASSVFLIGGGVTVTISGLTIADGENGIAGGGIYNEGVVTLNNCTLSGNKAGVNGGGIYNSGTVTLNNCTVRSNTAGLGGGILNFGGTVTLNNCTVSNNTASNAGGILTYGGTVTLNNCTVSNNTASDAAGGIFTYHGTATLNNCTVSNNTASNAGGAIFNNGTVTLNNCTVSNNTASNAGGGIYNYEGTVTLNNCTVSGNSAYIGGGIYNEGTVTLNNCTVSSNTANTGGGICNFDLANLKNSIIAGNNAGTGPDFVGTLTSYGCNLVHETSECTITGNVTCNIYGEDPLLGPLQDNGGPTFTHALLEGSPAIDGVCTDCGCITVDGITVTTDQRGEPRPADGDWDGTALCDMGAYELQPPPTQPAPPGVPTVNHWGVVAMITLFAGLLVWMVRRRQAAS